MGVSALWNSDPGFLLFRVIFCTCCAFLVIRGVYWSFFTERALSNRRRGGRMSWMIPAWGLDDPEFLRVRVYGLIIGGMVLGLAFVLG